MATLTVASRADQALVLPVVLGASYVTHKSHTHAIRIEEEDVESLSDGERVHLTTDKGHRIVDGAIMYYLMNILDTSPWKAIHINEWLHRSVHLAAPDLKSLEQPIKALELHLTLRSYIVGYSLTLADMAVWGALRGNKMICDLRRSHININRWFTFIEDSTPWISDAVESLNNTTCRERPTANAGCANTKGGFKNTISGIVTRLFH